MVSSFRFGGGMGSRPRRAHSRLGGAAVVTGSGEVAPKLHGPFGPRRITPLSRDKTMPLTSSIFETLVHFLQLGAKRRELQPWDGRDKPNFATPEAGRYTTRDPGACQR